MQQINENLFVIQPGDPIEEQFSDMIKIYLAGTQDLNTAKIPWQQKFINALARLTSTEPEEGMIDLRNYKIAVINPLSPSNGPMSLQNPEFTQKLQWELQYLEVSDVIFCNYLRKGKEWTSLAELLMNVKSEKLITRCPLDSEFYSYIKVLGQTYGFSVIGETSSSIAVIKIMFESIPKLKELCENPL